MAGKLKIAPNFWSAKGDFLMKRNKSAVIIGALFLLFGSVYAQEESISVIIEKLR
jgi:hypothetical protein